jgi:hypothetical protein
MKPKDLRLCSPASIPGYALVRTHGCKILGYGQIRLMLLQPLKQVL